MRFSIIHFTLCSILHLVSSSSYSKKAQQAYRDVLSSFYEKGECHVLGVNIESPELLMILNEFASSILNLRGDLRMSPRLREVLNKFSSCKIFVTEDFAQLIQMDRFGAIHSILPDAMFYFSKDKEWRLGPMPEVQSQHLITFEKSSDDQFLTYLTCKYYKWNSKSSLINVWRPIKGMYYKKGMNFDSCKNSIEGQMVRIKYVPYIPYFFFENDELKGAEVQFMSNLVQALKFQTVWTKAKTWGTWYEKTNKTDGMIDDIRKGSVDLAVSTPGISYHRYQIARFTDIIDSGAINYICRKPVVIPSYLNLIKPFTSLVWKSIIVSTLLISIVFYIFYTILQYINESLVRKNVPPTNFLILSISYLLEQGNINWFSSWSSGRIIEILWDAIRTILILAYCCNLRAFLILKEYTKPVDSVYDLVEQKRELFMYGKSMTSTVVLNSPLEIDKEALKLFDGEFLYYDSAGQIPMEHHSLIVERGACMTNLENPVRATALPIIKNFGHFPYHFAKNPIGVFYSGFMMPKWKFPWAEEVSRVIRQMRDMNIYQMLLDRYRPSEIIFKQKDPILIEGLKLDHFYTVFFILLLGICIASIQFLGEMYCKRNCSISKKVNILSKKTS